MEISTFDDDLLQLSDFAKRLEKFVEIEHGFVDGSLVLALSSKFGSGKSTFLRMWKSDIESRDTEDERRLVVLMNAWESDYYGDPLYSIVSSLVESLETRGGAANSLIEAAKDVGWMAAAVGGQVARKFTGVDPVAAGAVAEKKKAARGGDEVVRTDAFSLFQARKNAMSQLKSAISAFLESTQPSVLFLVDELDRCRPDYAIAYLETIKHIFDMQGAVFIIAADRQQLENSARSAFGPDLDFEEYYRKFVHREVTLPPISESGYQRLASKYVDHYLEREGLRSCYMELGHVRVKNIVELVAALRLTPRQIQEMFRILGHVLETSQEKAGRLYWCLGVGSIAMAALKVSEPKLFSAIGSGSCDPQHAFDFLGKLLGRGHEEWWFTLFLTGNGLRMENGETMEDVLAKVGLRDQNDQYAHVGSLTQWAHGWGDSFTNRFVQIHKLIEQISQWN